MPSALEAPCARCGRRAAVGRGDRFAQCGACSGSAAPRYGVRRGDETLTLDRAAIGQRLAARTLSGDDWVVDGEPRTIASHPDLRGFFLPGGPDELRAPPARRRPPVRALALAGALGMGALVLAAFVAVGTPLVGRVPVAAVGAPPPAPPPPVAAVAPPPPLVVDPVADPLLEALAARVGVVRDPRLLLVTRAWNAYSTGTRKGRADAIGFAERAVVRAPGDADAMALLAELYAAADAEPELRAALLKKAMHIGRERAAVRRAMAMIAVAEGRSADAREAGALCVQGAPEDLLCREAHLRATDESADPGNLLYTYDELARRWPSNLRLPGRAAVVAVRGDTRDAEERVAAARSRARDAEEVLAAGALLDLRNGRTAEATEVATRLGDAVPPALAVEVAALAVSEGEAEQALRWLSKGEVMAEGGARARLVEAQARMMLAESGEPGRVAAALASAAVLDAKHEDGPAATQVKLMAAFLAKKDEDAARAWTALDAKGANARDVSRTTLARVRWEVSVGRVSDAVHDSERAVALDPGDPEARLWLVRALILGQNGPGLSLTLNEAARLVDGQLARRTPIGGAMAVPAPRGEIRAGLVGLAEGDPALKNRLEQARAVIAWLEGDLDQLAAELDAIHDEAATWPGLRARLLLARGDVEGALVAATAAAAMEPNEPAWQLLRARALLALGRNAEAERPLASVRIAGTRGATLHILRARVARSAGDPATALEAARAAVAADPLDLEARLLLREVD